MCKVYNRKELVELKYTYNYSEYEFANQDVKISSQIEDVFFREALQTEINPNRPTYKYIIERSVSGIEPIKVYCSKRYHLVSTSRILNQLFKAEWFDSIIDQIDSLHVTRRGDLRLRLNPITVNTNTLDVLKTDGTYDKVDITTIELVKKNIGVIYPEIIINNSYDKTKAVRVSGGFFRLVCGNGLVASYDVSSLNKNKVRTGRLMHVKKNAELIDEKITEAISIIPELINQSGTLYGMLETKIAEDIKTKWVGQCKVYLKTRSLSKTAQTNATYSKNIVLINKVVSLLEMQTIDNVFEFENVFSFFTSAVRYDSTMFSIVNVVVNKMKRLLVGKGE